MGYPATDIFDIKFIERTKKNLEDFKGENNFTNLINNLIGLIFIPHEYNNKRKRQNISFLKKSISEIEEFANIFSSDQVEIIVDGELVALPKFKYIKDNKALSIEEVKTEDLLRLMRNSFAHANLTPFGEGNIWQGVIIKNYQDKKKERKDKYNFIAVLKRKELEKFAITIADLYLDDAQK